MGKVEQLEINKSMPEAMECVWSNFKKYGTAEFSDINVTEIPNTNKGLIAVNSSYLYNPQYIVDFESIKNELTLVTISVDYKSTHSEHRKKLLLM